MSTLTPPRLAPPLPPTRSVVDRALELIPDIPMELEQLDREREQEMERHRARLAQLDNDRKRLDALRRLLTGEPETPRQRRKPFARRMAAAEALIKVIDAINVVESGATFTALEIGKNAEISDPVVYRCFEQLREVEFIGKVAREEKLHGRHIYRVLDPERGAMIRAQAEAKNG